MCTPARSVLKHTADKLVHHGHCGRRAPREQPCVFADEWSATLP
jgi:hypothetical protein